MQRRYQDQKRLAINLTPMPYGQFLICLLLPSSDLVQNFPDLFIFLFSSTSLQNVLFQVEFYSVNSPVGSSFGTLKNSSFLPKQNGFGSQNKNCRYSKKKIFFNTKIKSQVLLIHQYSHSLKREQRQVESCLLCIINRGNAKLNLHILACCPCIMFYLSNYRVFFHHCKFSETQILFSSRTVLSNCHNAT